MRTISTLTLLLLCTAAAPAQKLGDEPIILGEGQYRYEWVKGWGKLPSGEDLGNTHGAMCVDSRGRIFVNSDTERAVMMFRPNGRYLGAWGKEFKGGLHGMCVSMEKDGEFLYLTHTGRHEVVKCTLDGEVIWTIGYPKESGRYKNAGQYKPTSVAVGPDGDVYVADGYGLSFVHQYDKNRKYIRTFGGRGTEPGQMRTPHGLWLDTRFKTPRLLVADRENHRIQIFDLEGEFQGMIDKGLRRPCNLYQHGTDLVVADLAGRISIINGKNKVVAQLGDNVNPKLRARNPVPRDQWVDGQFTAPHGACFDADGNIYVMDWNRWGRLTKLARRSK